MFQIDVKRSVICVKHWVLDYHWFLSLLVLVVAAWAGTRLYHSRANDLRIASLTVAGGALGIVYFLQQQRLSEMQLMHQLFTGFNDRFDRLNEALNEIIDQEILSAATATRPKLLTRAQKRVLNDYFNLCGEEYFFYQQTFIHPKVWETWLAGMIYLYEHSNRVRNLWDKELDGKAYYGMTKSLLGGE